MKRREFLGEPAALTIHLRVAAAVKNRVAPNIWERRNRPSFWAKRGKNWGKFGVVMLLIPNCFIPIQFIVESWSPSNQV